jgi:signal transduction histidine kinase
MNSTPLPATGPYAPFAAIARALTESLELSEVLRRIANEARALTDATGVSILLLRGELAEFVAHASPPPGSLIPVGFHFRPGEVLVDVLRDRTTPLVIQDVQSSPLIPEVIKERIFVRDLIIVPLRVDEHLIGVLNLAFNELPAPWPWDPLLFAALADQAALAVRNAQLYEAARNSNEQLVQAEKLSALGRLVARVTHELNNPLTTARLLTESLDLEPLPYPAMELVFALGRELEHAAAVVNDLLLFVHRGQPELVEVALGELIQSTVLSLDRRLAGAGVALTLDLPDTPVLVRADPHGMRQVLSNLILNAVQALSTAPAERRIRVRARVDAPPGGSVVVVEVEDNGPGISPAAMERLFEPFFTTKPMGEGTGLGLSIIKGVLEAHGGEIEFQNVPTGGALFRFRLPVVAGAPARDVAPEVAEVVESRAVPAGVRVLVIDDETELQQALRRLLLHLGCEVTTASRGEEGLEYARAGSFELVLCDIRIPGLHGRELYDRFRLQAPAAADALVFMTGDTITREIRDFIAESGRPSLTKPFGRTQLQELLAGTLRRR